MGAQITASSLLRTALELTKFIGGDFEYPGFALCKIYLQLSINHREIIRELDNYENWPANMWFVGDTDHLKNQIRGLRRLCMVSKQGYSSKNWVEGLSDEAHYPWDRESPNFF